MFSLTSRDHISSSCGRIYVFCCIYESLPPDGSHTPEHQHVSLSDFTNPAGAMQRRDSHQPAVNGDALFGSMARRSGSLQPLRTSQVHEVKLGRQRLVLVHLRVSVGDSVISLGFLLCDKKKNMHANTD